MIVCLAAMEMENSRVILDKRPGVSGEPKESNFKFEMCSCPTSKDLQAGEILLKTCYLSVDPALRCCMNEDTGVKYMSPWQIGETIRGLGGIGVVLESRCDQFQSGDLVYNMDWPWTLFFIMNSLESDQLYKVDKSLVGDQPSLVLGPLGLTGLTAYLGITEKGHIKREGNQTCFVSAAAGACGSLAGQIAKITGCIKVIGICGSDEKCDFIKSLGFSHAVNYKNKELSEQIKKVCPEGIDVYFDNVGGEISDVVIKQMNLNSHVILCGQISQYNSDVPYPPPLPPETMKALQEKNITRERFLVLNYKEKFAESIQVLAKWLTEGKLKVHETVAKGLDKAGWAFVSMMNGGNIGKQIVYVAEP